MTLFTALVSHNLSAQTFKVPTFDEGMKEWGTVLGVLGGVCGGVVVGLEAIKMGYYFAGKCPHPWEGGH